MLMHCSRSIGSVCTFQRTSILWITKPTWITTSSQRYWYGTCHPSAQTENDVLKEHATSIFQEAVNAVLPDQMVKKALKVRGDELLVSHQSYGLHKNVHIAAFGKAVAGMVRAAEDTLQHHIVGGTASIPKGIQETLRKSGQLNLLPSEGSRVHLMEGAANNITDHAAHEAARRIHEMADSLQQDDILLTLISGGGSALLPLPEPPITMEELADVTMVMAKSGANIQELNTVRKNLDLLKGGGLAKSAYPAKVISLILSDVIDDPLDLIASGPTVQDPSSPQQSLDLFQKLQILTKVPDSVIELLKHKINSSYFARGESQVINSQAINNAQNVIVGSNKIAIDAAYNHAVKLGYNPYILTLSLEGTSLKAGSLFANLAHFICEIMQNRTNRRYNRKQLTNLEISLIEEGIDKNTIREITELTAAAANEKPVCILAGGETVVEVRGQGQGGRNQEIALAAGLCFDVIAQNNKSLSNKFCVQLLSGGTDGQDGPTDATGAFADLQLIARAQRQGLDASQFLLDNNSYAFFDQLESGRDHLKIGLTGTNVMDVQVLLVKQMYS